MKVLFTILFFFLTSTLSAQVTAVGHISAQVIDDVSSISSMTNNTFNIDKNSSFATLPTEFKVNDTKNIAFFVMANQTPTTLTNLDGESIKTEQTLVVNNNKLNINTTIPTLQSGEYLGSLSVNIIYN